MKGRSFFVPGMFVGSRSKYGEKNSCRVSVWAGGLEIALSCSDSDLSGNSYATNVYKHIIRTAGILILEGHMAPPPTPFSGPERIYPYPTPMKCYNIFTWPISSEPQICQAFYMLYAGWHILKSQRNYRLCQSCSEANCMFSSVYIN